MRTLRTSVRRLVEFLLRSGDIGSENDLLRGSVEAALVGGDIHRMLQAQGGEAYQAEVPLVCSIYFPDGSFNPHAARLEIREEAVHDQKGFFLCVEGRADGIIDDGAHPLVIDEIKGVSRDVSTIEEPAAIHEAQALCYAYLYLRKTRGSSTLASAFGERVVIRLTYASMTTGEVRQIERMYDIPRIETWFFSLLDKAQRWAAWRIDHDELRDRTLSTLAFPLRPRDSQRELMGAVATAIHQGKRLYAQAPTGSGKTLATLYPALKAMGSGEVSRIAYLTAKTMTRRAALECLDLLRQQSIATNVLVASARDKICPLRANARGAEVRARPLASLCNPVECPLARGHYNAVNDALYEAITAHDVLDAGCIGEVAAHHHVCPYELQRDAARWSDVIICDYHYAFAPSAGLFGLSDEPGGDTVLLVDEAHNLVERMREMYSAELAASELEGLERLLRKGGSFSELAKAVRTTVSTFPAWSKALPANAHAGSKGRGRPTYQKARISDAFVDALTALASTISATLEELSPTTGNEHGNNRPGAPTSRSVETFLTLRDVDFKVHGFLAALQRSETGYVTFLGRTENGGRKLKIYCVDPSHDLDERLKQARAAVFFSGTLLLMDYHRKLLAAKDEDASLDVQSSFDHSRQKVLIGSDVSARYSQRGPKLYDHVAAYLLALTHAHPGNYLVFLPSYAMLEEVAKALGPRTDGKTTIVRQRPRMREDERERFVARFRETHAADASLVGLCVLGGIFGESIDLPGEALVGVVIVGTGMPRASAEREVIRDYFDAKEGKGFAYAYTYPGLNKVLQAAGRLIRTEEDRGVVLLLDDRFLQKELREAFPKEWENVRVCTLEDVGEK
ncbi:MAG: ATP-dependent DNA helicase [Atopobiaceae bacterium]|nr:ATP-dependent DNA helicase [Atopobiaceae bacterium]